MMEGNANAMVSLNGSNYYVWKLRMKDLLYLNDCYLPVFALEKPENKTDEEWTLCHRRVCGYIRQWVDDNVFIHVSEETNAQSLWNKLKQLYAPNTGSRRVGLVHQLMRLKYQDGTPMVEHLSTFQGIINQLVDIKIKFEDEVQAIWLLSTLPDSWNMFVTSLNDSAPGGVVTLDLVKSSVLIEEIRRKSRSSSQLDLSVIEKRGRSKSRGSKNRDKSINKINKFADVECYHCGLKGHVVKHCRERQQLESRKPF